MGFFRFSFSFASAGRLCRPLTNPRLGQATFLFPHIAYFVSFCLEPIPLLRNEPGGIWLGRDGEGLNILMQNLDNKKIML